MKPLALTVIFTFLAILCPSEAATYEPSRESAPEPAREFRAAWIATVWNVDWPSRTGLSPSQQRAEMIGLLDMAAGLKLNAIIFQVRPECDALYESKIEPWSHWLSGTQGVPPSDGYDPLEFTIREAHRRGLELHAWFNPYRARANQKAPASSRHISRTDPQYLMSAGSQTWLNPAHKAVQDRAVEVMVDVTRRYNVDGIHIDDYFYPYPKSGKILFNDSAAYQAYRSGSGTMELIEWRRNNVNTLIRRLQTSIKETKPHVKFGISPFGIWRPGVPNSIEAGVDAFHDMAADSRTWLREGWVDYLAPQLYWSIDQKPQSFTTLIKWWDSENTLNRHLWPGIATVRIKSAEDKNRTSREILQQIAETRKHASTKTGTGHIHWSISALRQDRDGIRGKLASSAYTDLALVPETPWLGKSTPDAPSLEATTSGGDTFLKWTSGSNADNVRWWVVQTRGPDSKSWRVERTLPVSINQVTVRGQPEAISVRAMGKTGGLSAGRALRLR